ncbi:hypothetical protein K0M31_008293 [Melipona bicolor]|uniref:Uncharacterized protein n=1 Tax=Melipona bicolor TaxID=60889 RepID=A0AA40KKE0_9HYME|nr:hypothetical protein K0M31_008293 [Melipona bicolor]
MGNKTLYRGEKDTIRVQRESIHLDGDLQRISTVGLPQRLYNDLERFPSEEIIIGDVNGQAEARHHEMSNLIPRTDP